MSDKLKIINDEPAKQAKQVTAQKFPKWLHRKMPTGTNLFKTETLVQKYKLNTVCEEAKCPNRLECYSKKTATFLALGSACTRACPFCEIDFAKTPKLPEADEPERIALSVKELGLKHVVITMVARDDLPDKGAKHIAEIIKAVRKENDNSTIEVLTSDFSHDFDALQTVLEAKPEIFNHNVETIERLSPRVRHKATYRGSLEVLRKAKESNLTLFVKSGLMLGLGEQSDEVKACIKDLKEVGCDIITMGQYLQPSKRKLRVQEFVPPETYKEYESYAKSIGVMHSYFGPFIRSSYNADLVFDRVRNLN